ncbi:MAG TPA: class I SAM-dependent methyltransferase [Nevskiaceae bacterium]|nr:class I SAM-dependent methyltransferase [Nevskiaceae bacterium]
MNFFDKQPVLYPWPWLLRQSGLKLTYKPREVWWKGWIGKLGLEKGQKLLDVGCGRGIFLDRLTAEFGIKAFGIDIAKEVIGEAKKKSAFKLDLRVADACSLPFSDGFFDVVISLDTLEHIRGKQARAVSEMVRVLKKGGKMLIYTINKNQSLTWNWLLDKLGIDVYQNVGHDPKLFIDPDWLTKELGGRGVKVLALDYFNSFFTLAVDELIMVLLSFWKRFFGWEKTEKFGKIGLRTLTFLARVLTPILRVFDLPWTIFGHSNGFLVLGEKR